MFRPRVKPRTMVFSSLLAGGSFAAFAIFGWGVETSSVVYAVFGIVLFMLALSVPALMILGLIKLITFFVDKYRDN